MNNLKEKLVQQLNTAIDNPKEEESLEQINFYKSLRSAIELKDIASFKDYLNSHITYDSLDKAVFDFLIDLEKVTIEAAAINFDTAFDTSSNKSYTKNPLLSTVSMSINLMLEEIKSKTIPTYYFEEIFNVMQTPAILTNMFGKIFVANKLWKYKFGDPFINCCKEIQTILPDALNAMSEIRNVSNPVVIKNAIIISQDDKKIKGYDVKVKHLFSYEKDHVPESYLFICYPTS